MNEKIKTSVRAAMAAWAGVALAVQQPNGGTATVFSADPSRPLADALKDIRAQRAGTCERAVVKLAPGLYELGETLELGAADSNLEIVGEPGAVLTRSVAATPGGVVDCAEVAPDAMNFAKMKRILPLFFYDGTWARPARWPNEGFATFSESVDTGVRGEYRSGTAATGKKLPGSFRFKDSRAEKWDFADGIRIEGYFFYDWSYESLLAKGYDAEKGVLSLTVPSTFGIGGPKQSSFFTERRFVVSNVRAELDAPGEYFYDRKTKQVAFVAPEGGVKEFRTVNRPGNILNIRAATNLVIRGVHFRYAADNAVRLHGCTDVILEDCRVSEVGGSGVQISAGIRCAVRRCEIAFVGGGGVFVDGGDRRTLGRGDNVVEGCRIHDYSIISHVYAPGVCVHGCGNVVRGNEIFNAPHSGVIYHGNEQLFESNHVHHVLLESCDAGVFYTGQDATARGNVLRWNLVEDSGIIRPDGRVTGTIAFYLDDCVAGSTIVSNTVRRVPKGVAIGGGHENLVLYNTFEDCPCGVSPDARALSCHKARWDRDWHQTEKLRQAGINREPWKSRYPLLSQYTPENYPRTPEHCKIVGNVFRRVGSWFSMWEPACKRSMFEIHDNVLEGARFGGSRILFLGDSITEGGKAVYYLQMALDLRKGAKAPVVLGCGRSGETAPGGLARWDGEPKALKGDKVFVMYGMNDVGYSDWGEFPPQNPELKRKQDNRIASFEKGMRGLIVKIRDAKAKPVLVTPTPYEEWSTDVKKRPGSNHCNKGLARCADVVRRLGVEQECEVVDLHTEMTRILSAHPSEKFNPDNIHPGFAGADLMAMLFLEQAGIRPEFSRVEFDAKGATSFAAAYRPQALPLPVDDEYRKADRCADLTGRINRETLVVRNLAPGRYALKADGKRLATFSAAELAAGVNLATLETPNQIRARELLAVDRKLIAHCSEMRVLDQVVGWSKQGAGWNLADAAQRKDFLAKKRAWVNATGWAAWGNHMLNVFERLYDKRDELAKTEAGYRAALKDCAPQGWKLELIAE